MCIKDFRISFVFITYIIAIYFSIAVYSFILKEFLFFFFFYSRELSAESKIKEFLIRLFNRLSERNLLRFFFFFKCSRCIKARAFIRKNVEIFETFFSFFFFRQLLVRFFFYVLLYKSQWID